MFPVMDQNLTVIYNNTCPICAREVAAYRRFTQARGLDIRYVGLDRDALAAHGLTLWDAARRFHVQSGGQLYDGIPAFALLWERLPHMRWMAWLVRLPVISTLVAWLYDHVAAPALFALHRRRERLGKAVHRG